MKELDAHSVDVVVTSPPYNIGTNYNIYRDAKTDEDICDWCEEWRLLLRDFSA